MTREIKMSLSAEDLAMVGDSERQSFEGISEGISFLFLGSGTIDPYTEELIPTHPEWMLASGTLYTIREGDDILGMSGRLKVGDYVAKFYYPDVVQFVECKELRREATGEVFAVAARIRTGLGPPFMRLELGLVSKPNE